MMTFDRRTILAGTGAALASSTAPGALFAQAPVPAPPTRPQPASRFAFEDVVRRARELSTLAYE
ncbi:MAG: glucan biosynthesis protein G, partial [Bosea sp. (in: a-proteobacteria)]